MKCKSAISFIKPITKLLFCIVDLRLKTKENILTFWILFRVFSFLENDSNRASQTMRKI